MVFLIIKPIQEFYCLLVVMLYAVSTYTKHLDFIVSV